MLPIPGTSSVEHLEENVAAASLRLSEDEVGELAAAGLEPLRSEDDLQRLAAVVDLVGLGGLVEAHAVGDERAGIEHARPTSIASTRSRWPITLAWPVRQLSALIQTTPMWTSARSA